MREYSSAGTGEQQTRDLAVDPAYDSNDLDESVDDQSPSINSHQPSERTSHSWLTDKRYCLVQWYLVRMRQAVSRGLRNPSIVHQKGEQDSGILVLL